MMEGPDHNDKDESGWPSAFDSVFRNSTPDTVEPSSDPAVEISDLNTHIGFKRGSLVQTIKQSTIRAAQVVFVADPNSDITQKKTIKNWLGIEAKVYTHRICTLFGLGTGVVAVAGAVGFALDLSARAIEKAGTTAGMTLVFAAASYSFWKWSAGLSDQLRQAHNKSLDGTRNR